jgi:tRNA threonylcarbamoyl adenosine modification protein YeaZ
MKALCVDTSSKEIGIALFDGDGKLFEQYTPALRHYNSVLLPLIRDALEQTGVEIKDVDVFASTLGPGSFTGIRVGMAAMKGFSQALDRPFFGLSTLEILARNLVASRPGWVMLDAGRGEVYAAYFINSGGLLKKRGGFILESLEKFASRVKKGAYVVYLAAENTGERLYALNAGARLLKAEHISMIYFYDMMRAGGGFMDRARLYTAAPVYIRTSEAEVVLKRLKAAGRKSKKNK